MCACILMINKQLYMFGENIYQFFYVTVVLQAITIIRGIIHAITYLEYLLIMS